jgi:integrase
LAVVTVRLADGTRRDIYLGKFNSPESRAEYARVVGQLAANTVPVAITEGKYPDLSINELCDRFRVWAETYYRNADGTPSSELTDLKHAVRPWRELYGSTAAADFGPLAFKTLRERMVARGWSRKTVNAHCQRVKRVIRWAVENELLPCSNWETLRAVRGLARGRTEAPEPEPRKPADPAAVKATLLHLPPMLAAAVRLIYLCGARPSEILRMRPCELDRSDDIWTLAPVRHKGTWRGGSRVLYLGPEAQAVLMPRLIGTPHDSYVFSPARAEFERNRERSANRTVKLWPSHAERNRTKRKGRKHKPYYDKDALNRAVLRACEKAKVEPWTPYQLRHLRAVELREQFGLEHARAVLGHAYASMSDHYSKAADKNLAAAVAAKIG